VLNINKSSNHQALLSRCWGKISEDTVGESNQEKTKRNLKQGDEYKNSVRKQISSQVLQTDRTDFQVLHGWKRYPQGIDLGIN
jgi:hypothetical protein